MHIQFDNSYARDLEGLYLKALPTRVAAPKLIKFNVALAVELGLDVAGSSDAELADLFSGNEIAEGAEPLAMAYAGHQFGHFSPQLGDGRAILLGEVIGLDGKRRDIQLKGPGRTPFSRSGDGRAALGPVLREYIVSEAMHALGIPATRALAAVTTGEDVYRETALPGGVFTRVAASHIRVGTFQFFASRGDLASLKKLTEYTIRRHYPDAMNAERPALAFLEMVATAHAKLIAKWVAVGFVHGVMNTDNSAISGETIDFGPCAFIDHYDPHALFSSIDKNGRYALSNQSAIGQWNLARLAETLVPLIDENADTSVALATAILQEFPRQFEQYRLEAMRAKLGLLQTRAGDEAFIARLLDQMQLQTVDYTNAFRALAVADTNAGPFSDYFDDREIIQKWLIDWQARLRDEGQAQDTARTLMLASNPAFIPRNHRIEEAIVAAVSNANFAPFHRLVDALSRPYLDQPQNADLGIPPREDERVTKTFCGT